MTFEYCKGGCGQLKDQCKCKELEEAKKQLQFNPPPDTTLTVGNTRNSKANKE